MPHFKAKMKIHSVDDFAVSADDYVSYVSAREGHRPRSVRSLPVVGAIPGLFEFPQKYSSGGRFKETKFWGSPMYAAKAGSGYEDDNTRR